MTSSGSTKLHIGIAGPCTPSVFSTDLDASPDELPDGLGGTPVNHLVRALLDLGHRVSIATLSMGVSEGEVRSFAGPRLAIYVGPYRARHRARDRFAVERAAVRDAMYRAAPDAISAHWSYEFALGAIDSGHPTLVTVRDVPREIFRHQPSPYRWVRWMMHRESMRRTNAVAFNSAYTRTRLGNRRLSNAPVLPNALPDPMWRLEPREPPSAEAAVFVSVNNGFGKRKNVGALLQAFAVARKQLPAARLQLIGEGFEPRGASAAWSSARELDVGVEFVGPKPYAEAMTAVKAADVLVHPALEESFGYTLIEAASMGTPVIAGKASGAVPWVLGEGAQGVLVDVASPEAIASAMIALVSDPVRWRELRERAFEVGRSRFSASAVAQDYVRLLGGLAHARAARLG